MRCRRISKKLVEYADGRLDRRHADRVAEHLSTCETCARACEEMKLARKSVLAIKDVPVPDGLSARLEAVLEREWDGDAPKAARSRSGRWTGAMAAATAGLALLLIAGFIFVFSQAGRHSTIREVTLEEGRRAAQEAPASVGGESALDQESPPPPAPAAAPSEQTQTKTAPPGSRYHETQPGEIASVPSAPGATSPAVDTSLPSGYQAGRHADNAGGWPWYGTLLAILGGLAVLGLFLWMGTRVFNRSRRNSG